MSDFEKKVQDFKIKLDQIQDVKLVEAIRAEIFGKNGFIKEASKFLIPTDKWDLFRSIGKISSSRCFCASFKTSVAVTRSPKRSMYPIITKGRASIYICNDGNPM